MAMLIQLRYRIKAIETIKKITHAMRLISMSSRSRLKAQEEPMRNFMEGLATILHRLLIHAPEWHHPFLKPENAQGKTLIILIGSSRGLCGNFNPSLFHFLEKNISLSSSPALVAVGKKAIAYAQNNKNYTLVGSYEQLSAATIESLAHGLMKDFINEEKYSHVVVVSNKLKTFFIQKPEQTQLITFEFPSFKHNGSVNSGEFYWEQSPEIILNSLIYQVIETQLHYLIFQSLLAEQAARFISMDNATRNAQKLLEEAQLQYNKLRQAKITRELTELISSM